MNRLSLLGRLLLTGLLVTCLGGNIFAGGEGEASGKPVNMTYLRFGGPDDITQEDALIERWEATNPGATIELMLVPFPQFKEKLDTMVAGGQSPDLVFGWPTPFANLWDNGRIMGLNELAAADSDFDWADYPQHRQFIFDDQVSGLPYNATAHILRFNTTMFEKAGLETPLEMYQRGAWTWENAIKVAKKLTVDEDGDGTPDQYGIVDMGVGPVQVLSIVWAFGGRLFNDDFTAITFDSPETHDAIQLIVDLVGKHKVAPPPEMMAGDIGISFDTGKVAIGTISGATIMLKHLRWEQPWEWGVVPYPSGPAGTAAWADGNSVGISVTNPAPEIAWDFITSLVDEASWKTRFDLELPFRLPPNINVINSQRFRDLWNYVDIDMLLDVMLGKKAIAPLVPRQADSYRIAYDIMKTEIENAVRGTKSVDQAIKDTVKQGNDVLEGY